MRVRLILAELAVILIGACGGGGGFPDAKEDNDVNDPAPGTFRLRWALTDSANATIDCTKVSAISVTAVVTSRSVLGGSTQVFSCGPGSGTSQPIAPGFYDITFELGAGFGIIASAMRQSNVEIKSGTAIDLAPIVFAVDATGGLKLHVATNRPGGNCGLASADGAGITGTTITLEHTMGAACEPVVFQVGAGATNPTPSMYTVNCAAPTVAPCIESDQEITTTTDIESGGYQIHIRGRINGVECWTNDDLITVPAGGMDFVRTLNLGFATGTPGC